MKKCQLCELPIMKGYEVKYFKAFYHPGCATFVAKQSTTILEVTELNESVKETVKPEINQEKEETRGEKNDASIGQIIKQKSATRQN